MFPSTLNATIGYEHPLSYGNAVELYGEAGTHWQERISGKATIGTAASSTSTGWCAIRTVCCVSASGRSSARYRKFFIGLEGGFEYSYVFRNGWEFALIQKNNVNFLHGDTFRNGLLLGVKIPFNHL